MPDFVGIHQSLTPIIPVGVEQTGSTEEGARSN